MYFRAARSNPVKLLHYGSFAVIAGYTISMSYRAGIVKRILNPSLYNKVEAVVEKVKEKTPPMGTPSRLSLMRRHLLRTYCYTISGMACVSIGAGAFILNPHVPILLSMAVAGLSGLIVATIPKKVLSSPVRHTLFHVCWLTAGYTLGPVGWIAQDVLATYVLVTVSTVIGFTIPLFLTRGVVSYIMNAFLLSSSLSMYVATSTTSTASLFGAFKSHPGVQQILQSDINGIVLMQVLSNFSVLSFHTVPQITKFVKWKGSEEALVEQSDALCQAETICAGWVYVGYRMIRGAFHKVLKKLSGKDAEVSSFSTDTKNLNMISSISSGLIVGVLYIQIISRLQQGDMNNSMESMRQFFRRIAPRLVPSRYG